MQKAGFKSIGKNVAIAKNCTIIGVSNISIGNNVRIDGYCSIIAAGTGYVTLGSYIHIGGGCILVAGAGVIMEDFSGLSQGVKIYSKTDDYSGEHLTNPTVPDKYTKITQGKVEIKKHVIMGSGSVVLPKVTIGEGSAIGALSLVTKSLDAWWVYFGSPVKKVKKRSKKILELEEELYNELNQ